MPIPAPPDGFRVEGIEIGMDGRGAQLRLRRILDPKVRHYDVVQDAATGPMVWLGRISCDALFVERVERLGAATRTALSLIPSGIDGGTGEAARIEFDWQRR